MRLVSRLACWALLLVIAAGCGPKRRVVIHPDELPGRRGEGWRVSAEPSAEPER